MANQGHGTNTWVFDIWSNDIVDRFKWHGGSTTNIVRAKFLLWQEIEIP
jgi:hypothetical protein